MDNTTTSEKSVKTITKITECNIPTIGNLQHQYLSALISIKPLTIKHALYRLSLFNEYQARLIIMSK